MSVFLTTGHVQAADDWGALISPYIWFAGIEGDLSLIPDAAAAEINVSPTDALNGTEASFMLMFEARKRRHGVLLDIFYSDVLQENSSIPPERLNWEASVKDTLVTVGYTYELYSSENNVIDVIGGLRYWEVDTKFSTRAGHGLPGGTTVHNSKSWLDPVVGVKAKYRLGQSRFYLAGFMGGGGAAGGSDSFYDLTANVGYQFSESIVTSIGYRVFDVDYDNDSFVYDVKQEGWLLGLVWILGTSRLAP
jgi:hypothetical protein